MKKLLLIFLIIALGYLTYNTIVNGMSIGELKIPSYRALQESNRQLDSKISELDTLIDVTYSRKLGEVATSKTDFNIKKQTYDSLAANATDEQLEAAMRKEEFLLDYLWIVIGNYANDNNVKFLMNTNDDYTIDFDVTGSYISIINFIYDLANDSELRFAINNIQLEGGSNQDAITKAKFTVYDINVITKAEDDIRTTGED